MSEPADSSNLLRFRPRAGSAPGADDPNSGAADLGEAALYTRFSASLRVFGKSLDLAAITSTLGIEPTDAHRRGELREPDAMPFEQDMWVLTAPVDPDEPLGAHLAWLYQRLAEHLTFLRDLKRMAEVDVYCGYLSNDISAGFEVPCAELRLFVELDVPFQVSVIVSED